MKRILSVAILLLAVAVPAVAAPTATPTTTPFAPVLLSTGEKLVLSFRADLIDWRPLEVAEGVAPCFLVGFKILDLAGNVVAESQQTVEVEPGEAVTFEVSHADVAQGIEPCFLVALVESQPVERPLQVNGIVNPCLSLQVADASGVRIYAEKGLAERKPQKLSRRLSFAPLLLAPGESLHLAAFNEAFEKAGGIQPCFLVGFQLVDLDGNVVAETQVPHQIDPGQGASTTYTYAQLFGNANLPQSVAVLAEVQPVELPKGKAGGVSPCMSVQLASAAGVEIYAAK
jgi:hypothetical protein